MCQPWGQEEVEVPELPETLSRDQKRILTTKGSVEWPAASPATETENAWVRRTSPSFLENNEKKIEREKEKENGKFLITQRRQISTRSGK